MNKSLLLLALCAIVSVLSSDQEDTNRSKPSASLFPPSEFDSSLATTTLKPKTNTTTPKPTTTTSTPKPKTTTSTPKPTTTTSTPKPTTTTSTPKPTTTTPTPKPTTTHSPTTANHTTSNHTDAPTTTKATTTASTSTAVPPEPQPTPSANLTTGNYTLKSGDGLCLMAQMALQIRVANNKTNGTFIIQEKLTKTAGSCQKSTANLTITFKEGFITFLFNKNTSQNTVYVNAVSFNLSYPFKSGEIVPYFVKNQSVRLFPAAVGHSYSCKKDSVYMGHGLYLDVTQDRMQAFNLTNNKDFGKFDACPADTSDYRVAIAVGIVLLVLIVIVVVAYLLGRRKRTDGYQSL